MIRSFKSQFSNCLQISEVGKSFSGLLERTGNAERAELLALKSAMDPLTQGWRESVGQCLKLVIDRYVISVSFLFSD